MPRFLTVSLARELGVLLCLSVMFPFMIHVLPVPGDARLGARLLPMFYAPLLAALWGRAQTAWLLAIVAPWLNWVLTAHPAPHGAIVLMVELLGFVGVLRSVVRRTQARWYLAGPAYFAGKAGALGVVAMFPSLIDGQGPLAWTVQTVATGGPGIVVLLLINWLAVVHYPSGGSGGGPMAA